MPKDGRRIQISLKLRSPREVKHLAFKYAVCSLALPCLHSLVSMRAKCKQKYVKFDCHITSTKYNSVDIWILTKQNSLNFDLISDFLSGYYKHWQTRLTVPRYLGHFHQYKVSQSMSYVDQFMDCVWISRLQHKKLFNTRDIGMAM